MRIGAIFATAMLLCMATPSVEAEQALDVDGTGTNGSAAVPTTPATPQSTVTDESITNNVTNNITNESEAQPEIVYVPTPVREVCTTMRYGKDIEETDCRTQPLTAVGANPALEGICTIRYGMRTCY